MEMEGTHKAMDTKSGNAASPAPIPASAPAPAPAPVQVQSRPAPAAPGAPERRKRRPRGTSDVGAVKTSFYFFEGKTSTDGKITSLGQSFENELVAQRASLKSGTPYLKIEILQVDLVEQDGKNVVETSPVKKQ